DPADGEKALVERYTKLQREMEEQFRSLSDYRRPAVTTEMVRARKPAGSFVAAERLFNSQVDEIVNIRAARRPQSSRHSIGGTHEFRMLPPLQIW
ncbi:hypothetical protein LPJ56_001240, partial [Coemansia sp. RSA 2599]